MILSFSNSTIYLLELKKKSFKGEILKQIRYINEIEFLVFNFRDIIIFKTFLSEQAKS